MNQYYQEYVDLGSPSCLIVPLKNNRKVEADFLHTNGDKIIKINRDEESDFYASGIQIINPNKINNKIKSSENFYNVWMELIKNEELLISNTNVYFWEAIDNFNQII